MKSSNLFKPEVSKFDLNDLPEDSVYRNSFPTNGCLWNINKSSIKKKDGSSVHISECELYHSHNIHELKSLLLNQIIKHPYSYSSKYIYIKQASIIDEYNENYPPSLSLIFHELDNDLNYNNKDLRYINELTYIDNEIKALWVNSHSDKFILDFIDPKLKRIFDQRALEKDIALGKNQLAIF